MISEARRDSNTTTGSAVIRHLDSDTDALLDALKQIFCCTSYVFWSSTFSMWSPFLAVQLSDV